MCLKLVDESPSMAEELRSKANAEGFVECWKLYNLYENGDLTSFFYNCPSNFGLQISGRKQKELTEFESLFKTVGPGFHVFLNKKDAEEQWQNYDNFFKAKNVIYKVLCHIDDLVACGVFNPHPSAVFMKLIVTNQEI